MPRTSVLEKIKMIQPDVPITRNKIRDAKICTLYSQEALTMTDLAQQFKMSVTRISVILKRNSHLLQWDQNFEKAKRIAFLRRELLKKELAGESTKKDVIEVSAALRDELDGKNGNTNINIVNSVSINNFSSLLEKFHADRLQS